MTLWGLKPDVMDRDGLGIAPGHCSNGFKERDENWPQEELIGGFHRACSIFFRRNDHKHLNGVPA